MQELQADISPDDNKHKHCGHIMRASIYKHEHGASTIYGTQSEHNTANVGTLHHAVTSYLCRHTTASDTHK